MSTAPPDAPDDATAPATSKLDLDWVKTAAGALAAVTTAVLLSTLGAAGTLIGAALGSVAATVGSAVYTQGLHRSRDAVKRAQDAALHLTTKIPQAPAGADPEAEAEPDTPAWRERLASLPWRRIALVALATFALAMVLISGFEKASGRSVSQVTGGSSGSSGSTVPGLNRSDDGGGQDTDRDTDRQDGDRDRDGDSDEPSDGVTPTDGSTADPTAVPTDPASTGATPAPSSTPTPTATTSPTPSATPTPSTSTTPRPTPSASATR